VTDSEFRARYGAAAVVAGASEGLGAAFAQALAARGLDLVLVARNGERLERFADQLQRAHPERTVRATALDLARPDAADAVLAAAAGLEVGLLVYNAASAPIGRFLDVALAEQLRSLDVNCRGPLLLAHALGRGMAERRRGGILLMSSLAGSQGAPFIATYGATKAFTLTFAEALWAELGEAGVDVLACRAGATRTPNYERARPRKELTTMAPERVVEAALGALSHGPSVVPGAFNRVAAFLMGRVLPRRSAVRTMGDATRKIYGL
jgi:short-subunit dehydrogenase